MSRAFGSGNNYASNSLRAYYNGAYLVSITDGNPDEIITRTVDLTALNGSTEYGTAECKLAPLTLDELRKYHDILPRPEGFERSVIPWSTCWGGDPPPCSLTKSSKRRDLLNSTNVPAEWDVPIRLACHAILLAICPKCEGHSCSSCRFFLFIAI